MSSECDAIYLTCRYKDSHSWTLEHSLASDMPCTCRVFLRTGSLVTTWSTITCHNLIPQDGIDYSTRTMIAWLDHASQISQGSNAFPGCSCRLWKWKRSKTSLLLGLIYSETLSSKGLIFLASSWPNFFLEWLSPRWPLLACHSLTLHKKQLKSSKAYRNLKANGIWLLPSSLFVYVGALYFFCFRET